MHKGLHIQNATLQGVAWGNYLDCVEYCTGMSRGQVAKGWMTKGSDCLTGELWVSQDPFHSVMPSARKVRGTVVKQPAAHGVEPEKRADSLEAVCCMPALQNCSPVPNRNSVLSETSWAWYRFLLAFWASELTPVLPIKLGRQRSEAFPPCRSNLFKIAPANHFHICHILADK